MSWVAESGYVAPGGSSKTTITVPIGTAAGTTTPAEGSDLLMAVWLAVGNSIADIADSRGSGMSWETLESSSNADPSVVLLKASGNALETADNVVITTANAAAYQSAAIQEYTAGSLGSVDQAGSNATAAAGSGITASATPGDTGGIVVSACANGHTTSGTAPAPGTGWTARASVGSNLGMAELNTLSTEGTAESCSWSWGSPIVKSGAVVVAFAPAGSPVAVVTASVQSIVRSYNGVTPINSPSGPIELDGSASQAQAGRTITGYEWTLEAPYRSALELSGDTALQTLPPLDVPGDYLVTLVVTDSTGAVSPPTTIRLGLGPNQPTVVVDGELAAWEDPNLG